MKPMPRHSNQITKKTFRPGSGIQLLHDRLRELAFAKGPEAKLPTVRELCAEYQTSSTSLNDVLKDLEASNVIYRRQGSGIFVSPKIHSQNIYALINASLVDQYGVSPFWGMLWAKLVRESQKRAAHKNEEIHFQLVASGPELMNALPPDFAQLLDSGRIDGLMTIGMGLTDALLTIPSSFPMISFAGLGHWFVATENGRVVGEAVRRLAALGCRRIGLFNPSLEWVPDRLTERFDFDPTAAFRAALEQSGLEYKLDLHFEGGLSVEEILRVGPSNLTPPVAGHQQQGYATAMQVFQDKRASWPDGLVITDDMMTLGVLGAMRKLGIQPGHDIKIASHSNAGSPVLFGWEEDLILWQADPAEIARAIYMQLDTLMSGEKTEQYVHVHQGFPD